MISEHYILYIAFVMHIIINSPLYIYIYIYIYIFIIVNIIILQVLSI